MARNYVEFREIMLEQSEPFKKIVRTALNLKIFRASARLKFILGPRDYCFVRVMYSKDHFALTVYRKESIRSVMWQLKN